MKLKVTKYWTKPPNLRGAHFTSLWVCNGFSAIIVASIILVIMSFPNGTSPIAVNAEAKETPLGEYSNFIDSLKQSGLNPVMRDDAVRRTDFSVKGKMVAMDYDNIQIFEYISSPDAKKEALAFANKHRENSRKLAVWDASRKLQRIYVKGNLVVFYMGSRENIIKTLDNTIGPSLIGNQQP